jgi:Carboxypeptidase regulatory-like domain
MKSLAVLASVLWVVLSAQTPPQTAEQADEHAKKQCVLQGVVVNGFNQNPLRKAKVTLKPVPGSASSSPYSVSTEADGGFKLEKVEPGRYILFAEKEGFVRGNYGAARPMGLGATLQLKEAQNLKDLTVKLTSQGALTGRILDADGEAVRGVFVYALKNQVMLGRKRLVPAAAPTATDDRGQYRISSLAPGKYFLVATSQTQAAVLQQASTDAKPKKEKDAVDEGYALTYYPNSPDVTGASPVDLRVGTEEIKLDLSMPKTRVFRISGKVVNAVTNSPMKGVILQLIAGHGENVQTVSAAIRVIQAESGEFEIANIPAGPYTLFAVSQALEDPMAMQLPITLTDQNLEGVVLSLGGGSDVPVAAKLEGAGADGQIANSDKDAKPLSPAGVRVLLRMRENPAVGMASVVVDKENKAVLKKLQAERYTLTLLALPDGIYLKSARFAGQEVSDSVLDARSVPANASLDLLFAATSAEFTGMVRNEKGEPVPGAIVTLVAKRTDLFRSATADQDGNFKVSNVAPGDYQVFAWEDLEGDSAEDEDFRKPFSSRAVKVSMSPSDHKNQSLTMITRETVEQAQAGH